MSYNDIHITMHSFLTAKFTTTITSMTSDSFQKLSSNKSVTNKRGCLDLVYISFEFNAFMLKLDQFIQKKKVFGKNLRFPFSCKNTDNNGVLKTNR